MSTSSQQRGFMQVNLPQGKAEKLKTDTPVTLTLAADHNILVNRTPVYLLRI